MTETISERISGIENKIDKIATELTTEAPKRSLWDKWTGKNKSDREFKLPSKVRKKKKIKQNYAVVAFIRNNGYVDFTLAPIVNDAIYIKQTDKYYPATADYIMRHKEYPMLIQPEWSIEPFSAKKHFTETELEGKVSSPQKFLIKVMNEANSDILQKKSMGGKMLIIVGVLVVVGIYLIGKAMGWM